MNQHPNILNYGEVLGDWNTVRKLYNRLPRPLQAKDEAAYLDMLMGKPLAVRGFNTYRNLSYRKRGEAGQIKPFRALRSVGVKEFSLNLQDRGIADYLTQRPHVKVIGLQRSDVLDRYISWKMLQHTGVVKLAQSATSQKTRLTLDPDTLPKELGAVWRENQALEQMLAELPAAQVFRVAYERLYGTPQDTQAVLQEVFAHLQLPAFAPELKMRKILKGSSLDKIANLEACRAAVAGSDLEQFLQP